MPDPLRAASPVPAAPSPVAVHTAGAHTNVVPADLRALIAENADLRVALCDAQIQLRHWRDFAQALAGRRCAVPRPLCRRPPATSPSQEQPGIGEPNERLRLALAASGRSQRGLARCIGVHLHTVERWIYEGTLPRRESAHQAARLLGVPVTWLFPGLDRPSDRKDGTPAVRSRGARHG